MMLQYFKCVSGQRTKSFLSVFGVCVWGVVVCVGCVCGGVWVGGWGVFMFLILLHMSNMLVFKGL